MAMASVCSISRAAEPISTKGTLRSAASAFSSPGSSAAYFGWRLRKRCFSSLQGVKRALSTRLPSGLSVP